MASSPGLLSLDGRKRPCRTLFSQPRCQANSNWPRSRPLPRRFLCGVPPARTATMPTRRRKRALPMARNHRIRKFCAGLWMHRKPFFRIAPGRKEASFRDRASRTAKARGLFRIRCLFAITGGSPCSHAARTSGPEARGMFHVKHPYEKTERPDGRHPGARMFHVKHSQLPAPSAVNARGARPRPHLRLRARRRGCSTRA